MALGTTWSVSFREAVCDTMTTAAVGAQTEHPGVAVAGEGVAWRLHLTGRFVYFFPSTSFAASARNSRSLWSGLRTGPPPRPKVSSLEKPGDLRSAAVAGSGDPATTRRQVGGGGRVRRPGHNRGLSQQGLPLFLPVQELRGFRTELADGPHDVVQGGVAIDLLDCPVIPASRLGAVTGPFRLRQVLLVGQLCVGQGQHDPLTVVAPAFQLAGFLQNLDAGLPVARPVLRPAQHLPLPVAGTDFSGFPGHFNRSARIAQFCLRTMHQNQAHSIKGPEVARTVADGLLEGRQGLSPFLRVQEVSSNVVVGRSKVRFVAGRLTKGALRFRVLPLLSQHQAKFEVARCEVRLDADGFAVGLFGLWILALAKQHHAKVVV